MTPTNQDIDLLKTQRESLIEPLKQAFRAKEIANQSYHKAKSKWAKLRIQFESIDREIALIELTIRQASKKSSRPKKTDAEQAKAAAIKALESLPKEMREQLLKTFQSKG